ncbi:hypothetical protein CYMTET_27853 [Cymbomonas tetramitiformis]|uniref:SET domain-containing protein n=1 Tax=Cymbomonas tetramitiformis TaxID=36881 RepID=A0AAE0FNZ0_9CHLO|nr:hypothetical protein CYMTET_27853 [Cymbomonas tetramitiformis]
MSSFSCSWKSLKTFRFYDEDSPQKSLSKQSVPPRHVKLRVATCNRALNGKGSAAYDKYDSWQLPKDGIKHLRQEVRAGNPRVELGASTNPNAGRGVFVTEPVKEGQLLTTYCGTRLTLESSGGNVSDELGDHDFGTGSTTLRGKVNPVGKDGLAQIINDQGAILMSNTGRLKQAKECYVQDIAGRCNVALIPRRNEVYALAIRDLAEGEELFWSYGANWWLSRMYKEHYLAALFCTEWASVANDPEPAQAEFMHRLKCVQEVEQVSQLLINEERAAVRVTGVSRPEDVSDGFEQGLVVKGLYDVVNGLWTPQAPTSSIAGNVR